MYGPIEETGHFLNLLHQKTSFLNPHDSDLLRVSEIAKTHILCRVRAYDYLASANMAIRRAFSQWAC